MKIIDTRKKSKWIVQSWHDACEKIKSPKDLKARLAESFPEDLPDDLSFKVGYFQGKSGSKRWIIEPRDLEKMYSLFKKKNTEINLWCEGKSPTEELEPAKKRAKTSGATRRELFEDEVETIFIKLKDMHPKFPLPKLRLWARLIKNGRYDKYDKPPDIPLISGSSAKPKESMTEAFKGAAREVVNLIQSGASDKDSTPPSTYSSPLKMAQFRRSCLDDLRKIKELFEDGVLTDDEFKEQKENILGSLKKNVH